VLKSSIWGHDYEVSVRGLRWVQAWEEVSAASSDCKVSVASSERKGGGTELPRQAGYKATVGA